MATKSTATVNDYYPVTRGWRPIPESDRRYKLFEEVYAYAKSIHVAENVEKPLLFEITSRWNHGVCYVRERGGRVYSCIGLNACLRSIGDDKMRNLIVHEFAHACVPEEVHGPKWYAVANAIGKKWGYVADRADSDEELSELLRKNAKRYEVYCKCSHEYYMYRNIFVREPQKFTCPICKTPLKSRVVQKDGS